MIINRKQIITLRHILDEGSIRVGRWRKDHARALHRSSSWFESRPVLHKVKNRSHQAMEVKESFLMEWTRRHSPSKGLGDVLPLRTKVSSPYGAG
jgi:hypothetical protein